MTRDTHTNLPAARMLLFGRAAELDLLADRVISAPGRLLTITGTGGVGKTSLALAVARHVTADFEHGVWLADLSVVTTAGAVPQAIARAVGVREGHEVPVADALRTFLHGRRLLLLMDNCEHLIDACAAAADELLDRCPGLRILATSREPLHVRGEVTYPLPPLPLPRATMGTDLGPLATCASVELFLDRARAVRPDFQLTVRNAGTVAEICSRLDGIPLALEMAASRVAGLPLDQIAERLRGSFDLLISKGRAQPARHQTLRATLEWSHDLLAGAERAVFRRLGAFAGGWTMRAAEFVCAGEGVEAGDVADVLASLVEKSLVVLDERDGEVRYRFLEPVRAYAQGRLAAAGESEGARDRHRAFFVMYAERAGPEMHRAEQAAWMRRLDRDLDNLRRAVRTAHARSDAESVLRLAGALWWYLWVRGHLREGLQWLEPALAADNISERARIAGLGAAAMLLGSLGRSEEAVARAEAMLSLAPRVGDRAEMARAATLLAIESARRGEPERALPLFERALADGRAAKHPMLIANALVNLGQVRRLVGELAPAEDLYRQGFAEFERLGDVWGIAYAANNLAYLLRQKGDPEQAARLSAQAVRLLTGLGDRFYLISAVEDLARASADARRSRSAARLFSAAHALRLATGALLAPGGREEYERDLGRVRAALGESAFAKAWAEGEQHPLDVLGEEAEPPPERPALDAAAALGGPGGLLTPRELEVVRLIGRGRSNRQIAEKLVITAGTAGVHVEHILRKLDLQSRHQVADWARARGLVDD
jgi:non-specific serine/threonine protein kinase